MRVSYNWLKEYVDIDLSAKALAEKLTMAGFEVEEIHETIATFEGIVIAKVEERVKHPDADKLSVCKVNDGSQVHQVICGAPNVAAGQTVAFATVGAVLPSGLKIKKAKIRGIESFGMICSEQELGISEESDGIWELPSDWTRGKDLNEQLKKDQDYILDIFITPNRPDAMSMIGMAREVAALTGKPLRLPQFELVEADESIEGQAAVEIQNPQGCPRYTARLITDLKIGPSPEWMARRLHAAGVRPINNLVDVTNYVLMEYGQPLHAFDFENITGNKIIVKDSLPGEKFTTLDDKERTLPDNTVMICDAERPVAIGGIMGGQNSEVSETTTTVLLESAYFTPERISKSAKRLGLISEASSRFERGVDPNGAIVAADRAAYLYAEIAGGKVLKGIIDVYPEEIRERQFETRVSRVNLLLGTDLSEKEIIAILNSLQIKYDGKKVTVPTFRPDLEREVDIIEEVAQMISFENIPIRKYTNLPYEFEVNRGEYFRHWLKETLCELGLTEVQTNSMLAAREVENAGAESIVKIMNPISDDLNVLRASLIPGLLKVAAHNINRKSSDFAIFEIGRIFCGEDVEDKSHQAYKIGGLMTGQRSVPSWDASSELVDFYDVKGLVESLLDKIFLDKYQFILYDNDVYLEADQQLAIVAGGAQIGVLGKVSERAGNAFEVEQPVYVFEIDVAALEKLSARDRQYQPYSKFPFVEQDLAFVADLGLAAGELIETIEKAGKPLISDVSIFDVFTDKKLGDNKKSIAVRMRFQSAQKTLKDKEVERQVKKIINTVERNFGIKLRD